MLKSPPTDAILVYIVTNEIVCYYRIKYPFFKVDKKNVMESEKSLIYFRLTILIVSLPAHLLNG